MGRRTQSSPLTDEEKEADRRMAAYGKRQDEESEQADDGDE